MLSKSNKPILLLGDCILDKYIDGDVYRISPEAPVPILSVENQTVALGGVGNVADNLKAMEANFELIYVSGSCSDSAMIENILQSKDIFFKSYESDSGKTVVKTRLMSDSHQIMRLDYDNSLHPKNLSSFNKKIKSSISRCSMVIISDYSKGSLSDFSFIIKEAKNKKIKVLIDPKNWKKGKYSGAFLIKPNYKELCEYLGYSVSIDDLEDIAKKICIEENTDFMLVTLGNKGMKLFSKDGLNLSLNSLAREVFDVTGAGDTVLACLAAFLQKGSSLNEALKMANNAAGIAVEKRGVASVSLDEVLDELKKNYRNEKALNDFVATQRSEGNSIVVTNGCFDVLHSGHLKLLKEASKTGDKLLVLLNSDYSVQRLKGSGRPILGEIERADLLSALEFVDYVYIFDSETPIKYIERIKPNYLVKGGDYKAHNVVGYELVLKFGGEVVIVDLEEGKSTSNIVKKIKHQ